MRASEDRPLSGTVVLDVSRMLPGAALARILLGLGARVLKVEAPDGGDPMRQMGPFRNGTGAGFTAFYAGAESIALDLRTPQGAKNFSDLSCRADVLVESFRTGTLANWGLAPDDLMAKNPRLVVCSLPGFAAKGPLAGRLGHDLNLTAFSGLLDALGGGQYGHLPAVQLADVTSGILAASAVLAALLERTRTGRGGHVEQPLMSGAMAFMPWLFADLGADPPAGPGVPQTIIAGKCPAYNVYGCADGKQVAIAAVEPKFWVTLVERVGLPDLAPLGLAQGTPGDQAGKRLADRLAEHPRSHWLDLLEDLPVNAVNDVRAALEDPAIDRAGILAAGPWRLAAGAVCPPLGRDTAAVLAEFCTTQLTPQGR